jgi:hypothetical protein
MVSVTLIERDNFKGLKGTIYLLKIKKFDKTTLDILCLILNCLWNGQIIGGNVFDKILSFTKLQNNFLF